MKYYIMIDGEQKGPYELEELPAAGLRPSTYVWCKGMSDWEKAEDVPDICRLYRKLLYDIMQPVIPAESIPEDNVPDNYPADNPPQAPTRFDKYLKDSGQPPLPTIEEIDSREDTSVPPPSSVGYAWLVTLLFFPPTGIIALVFSYKSKSAWKAGEHKLAYDYNRAAKMWTGISLFMGLILYAFLIRFF